MDNFSYWAPTRYVFGTDAETKAGELAKEAGWKKVILFYGGGSAVRSGLLDRVCASLHSGRFYYLIFQTGASRQNLIRPRLSAFVSCKINDLV